MIDFKERLKEVLLVQTHTYEEDRMIDYLSKWCESRNYNYSVDNNGNIYITKGISEYYPLVLAHTDTVHPIINNFNVIEVNREDRQGNVKSAFIAMNEDTNTQTGIGGDDKAGIFICLELIEKLDVVKAFFPVSEETGCHGTRKSDPSFFTNVAYAIQFDSTENDTLSESLMGVTLFERNSEFINKVEGIILEHGFTEWLAHPYTDIMILKQKYNFACLNLAAGYYKYHSKFEYVIIDDVKNAIETGEKIINTLGNEKYLFEGDHKPIRYFND